MPSFRRGRHVVHDLHVHLVFTTKYRRGVIDEAIGETLRRTMDGVCRSFGADLVAFDGEDDHVHLLVRYPPKVPLSKLVNSLKGASAYIVRQEHWDAVRDKLWGSHFWSPSYCAVSCGGAPLETVRRYVEEQRAETRRRGRPRRTASTSA